MHDLHEADKILQAVLRHAENNGLNTVNRINLRLGKVVEHGEILNPENLAHNIRELAKDGPARGAMIEIKRSKGNLWELVSIDGS